MQLQNFLIAQKLLAAGNATGYFGKLTQGGVQSWQKKNTIVSTGTPATTGYGVVGPKTRAAIARVCLPIATAPPAPSATAPSPPVAGGSSPRPTGSSGRSIASPTNVSSPPTNTSPPPSTEQAQASSPSNAPEAYGAIGNGIADDTAALQKAINGSSSLVLASGKTYRITHSLNLREGSSITSDSTATILLGSNAGEFTNTSIANKFSTNAVGIMGAHVSNVRLSGFKIKKEYQAGSVVSAVAIRGGRNNIVDHLDISGLSSGEMIRFDSVQSGRITDNYLHDSVQTAGKLTLSAIAIDADRLTDAGGVINSVDLVLKNNSIRELTTNAANAARNIYETDGISAGTGATGLSITDNSFVHVGEAIDFFGQTSFIDSNYIYEPYGVGIKVIHGASDNYIRYNKIYRAGLYGILISGSNAVSAPTARNTVTLNEVHGTGLGPADWSAWAQAGIGITDVTGASGYPESNDVYANTVSSNYGSDWAIACSSIRSNAIYGNTVTDPAQRADIVVCN